MRKLLITNVLLLGSALSTCGASGQQEAKPARFVAGEVIVKFSEDSPAYLHARSGDPGRDPSLQSYFSKLSAEIGIPVRPSEVTSGGEFLLVIDEEDLNERMFRLLQSDPRVTHLRELTPERKYITEKPKPIIIAQIKGSKDQREAKRLKQDLEKDLGFMVLLQEHGEDELAFSTDLERLTLLLVEILKEKKDVEYAQVNEWLVRQQ